MLSPEIHVFFAKIGHDVFEGNVFEDGASIKIQKLLNEMVGEAARARSQFDDVQGLARIEGRKIVIYRVAADSITIADEAEDHLGVSVGDKWVAGDVMRDGALPPGIDPLPFEEIALELPKDGLGQGLALIQDTDLLIWKLVLSIQVFVHRRIKVGFFDHWIRYGVFTAQTHPPRCADEDECCSYLVAETINKVESCGLTTGLLTLLSAAQAR